MQALSSVSRGPNPRIRGSNLLCSTARYTNWGRPELGPLFGIECYDGSGATPKLIGSLLLDAYAGDVVYQRAGTGNFQVSEKFVPRNEYHHYTRSLYR